MNQVETGWNFRIYAVNGLPIDQHMSESQGLLLVNWNWLYVEVV